MEVAVTIGRWRVGERERGREREGGGRERERDYI
jgi:hypothetical protein